MQEIIDIRTLLAGKEHNPNIENAENLFFNIKPKLEKVKNEIGESNASYINISSEALGHIQEIIGRIVNQNKPRLYHTDSYFDSSQMIKRGAVLNIKMKDYANKDPKFNKFWDRTQKIVDIHLNAGGVPHEQNWVPDMDSNGFPKYTALYGNRKKSEGCYIATMAYGDYDHPQVLKLRKFRDETLNKTLIGKGFIKLYYMYSPKLVSKLNHHKKTNRFFQILLDKFIKSRKL